MKKRPVLTKILIIAVGAFLVNRYLVLHQSAVLNQTAADPTAIHASLSLPGTIVVAQKGALYQLKNGNFSELTGPAGWSDPSRLPNGTGLLAVQRGSQWSDIYELGFDGSVKQQLTNNQAPIQNSDHIGQNDWAFMPQVGTDGRLYYAYDAPKSGYQIDMSIWSAQLGPVTSSTAQEETTPHSYTGGDVSPVPLSNGSLLFVKYSVLGDGTHTSQLWWQQNAHDPGRAVTKPADHCAQPSVTAGNEQILMTCSPNEQQSDVMTASFDPNTGNIGALHRLVGNCLCAQPVWAPDGKSAVYLAPSGVNGYFQLWWLNGVQDIHPSAPVSVSANLDFDATSAPIWMP